MKMKGMVRIGIFILLTCALLSPGISASQDVILDPGYISGIVSLGSYTVNSVYVNASGNGYSAYKYTSGNNYTMTVQGGTWNYDVYSYALVQPVSAYAPYSYVYFKNRSFPVPIGATVTNDYLVTPGTVRFQVNISGDSYSTWYAYGYAYVYPSGVQEQTYSYSYTDMNSASAGSWNMPVVPNSQIRIYAYVYVDGKEYDFYITDPDLLYADINPDQTLVVPLNIVHTTPSGTVRGTVQLDNVDNFVAHYVYWSGSSATVTTNPGTYEFNKVYTGLRTFQAYSYFDNYSTMLWWPYLNGNPANNQVLVEEGLTYTKDFIESAGTLTGDLKITGTLTNPDLSGYGLTAYGASSWYTPDAGWTTPRTYGGWGQQSKSVSDPTIQYRLFLTPGPWLPYYVWLYSSNTSEGYYKYSNVYIYDYNYYYNGDYYNYGQYADIKAGETVIQNREYCVGSISVRYRVADGGLVSYPTINGYMSAYRPDGKPYLTVNTYGYSGISNAEAPSAEVHGPTGPYTLTCNATTENGSTVTFGVLNVTLECGVRKGQDISGPALVVTAPASNMITNAQTVTVSGTASDDAGIAEITVNGVSVPFTPTGNLNEVAFSYDLAAVNGKNVISVRAVDNTGNESTDERSVYVDRWAPEISISSPGDGSSYQTADTIPVQVQVSDQGYGFSMRVYLDGVLRYQTSGDGNDTTPVAVSFSEIIGPLSTGIHVVSVEADDIAGNSASASVRFSVASSIIATIIVKPESRNNKERGTCTIFVQLPDGLTSKASLNPSDTREITATPYQYPYDVRYASDEDKLILKFTRTPELVADQLFTVEGNYCPDPSMPGVCFAWKGSDTTKR